MNKFIAIAVVLIAAAIFSQAEDAVADLKWGSRQFDVEIGVAAIPLAKTIDLKNGKIPIVVWVKNCSDVPVNKVNRGRFQGMNFYFINNDGTKFPVFDDARGFSLSLTKINPGNVEKITTEIPVSELKKFELPVVVSIKLWDEKSDKLLEVFSNTLVFTKGESSPP